MPKYNQHVRLPLSLFNHPGYLGLAEEHKAKCLAILIILLRFANPKTGSCYPRYSKIKEMIGLSRITLYRCIKLMIDNKLLIKKRLSSTNLYTLSPVLLVNNVSDRHHDVSDRYLSGISKIPINKYNINNIVLINNVMKERLDKIVNDRSISKDNKISLLSDSLSLPELQQCIKDNIHPYYTRKAIEHKEQELRDARAVPRHVIEQTMTAAVSKTIKNRSASYKAKVEYNKRNNLDWQGKPKK
jgi:hypothetical protein